MISINFHIQSTCLKGEKRIHTLTRACCRPLDIQVWHCELQQQQQGEVGRDRGEGSAAATKPSLTLEFVQAAGLSFGQEVGVGVFPGIHFAHEQRFQPAVLTGTAGWGAQPPAGTGTGHNSPELCNSHRKISQKLQYHNVHMAATCQAGCPSRLSPLRWSISLDTVIHTTHGNSQPLLPLYSLFNPLYLPRAGSGTVQTVRSD